ncbi:hypothetical protein MsAg5_15160 [Methanosarcinaceae archaeon Ag5]|uniref:CARDB domain-containing protein n=1 Tax=Methanolapillus africanus TaxID=3028297 RepID=A0AAE4SDP7_9EURY|nr:hypothetical protein [Methanosarcinaceae archaeon Ag5]
MFQKQIDTLKIKKEQQTDQPLKNASKNKKFSTIAILLLIAAIYVAGFSGMAGAASPSLKLTMIEQDPYPAQPGEQLRVWIQAENVGSGTLENVTIRIVQNSPFSISSGDSSKTYSYIYSGSKVYNEFFLSVANDATKGPRDLKVQYRIDDGNWIETTFSINIGGVIDSDSKGTLIVENVTSDPGVFMPGDSGIVWVTLKNNATSPTVTISNKTYETTARIQSIDLYSTDDIVVTSMAMDDLGIIAAGDTIKVPFRITVPENMTDGTYLLTLNVTAGSYQYNIKRTVEIKVDSDGIKSIQSGEPRMNGTNTTIEIDIVNYHQGAVRGVTVIPEAEGMTFYPSEYFIGEMDPDDLYTAKFNVKNTGTGFGNSSNATGMAGGQSITLQTIYYNGDNAHEDVSTISMSTVSMQNPGQQTGGGMFTLKNIAIVVIVLLIAAFGANYYLKKKKNTTLSDYSKEKFQNGKTKFNDWKQKRADAKQTKQQAKQQNKQQDEQQNKQQK